MMITTCNICGTDRVTMKAGVLTDVAVYPTARYTRGPHFKTCIGPIVVRDKEREWGQTVLDMLLAQVADGVNVPVEQIEKAKQVAAGA